MNDDKISKRSKEVKKLFESNKTPYGRITYYLGHPMVLKATDARNFFIDYEVNEGFTLVIE